MSLVFLLFVFKIVTAKLELTASWSVCTGNDAKECVAGKYGNITNMILPEHPPVSQNWTIVGTGDIYSAIQSPSISWRVKSGTLIDTTIKVDACNVHKYIFPLGDGEMWYNGISCPTKQGSNSVNFTANVNSLGWHSPDNTAHVIYKLYDQPLQQGNCVLCVNVQLVMTGH